MGLFLLAFGELEGTTCFVELAQLLGDLPVALVPIALVLYYSNQNTLKWMSERKEIAEAILAERKDWQQERREMIERQFSLQERLTTELEATRGENHAIRNKLTEMMIRLDSFILRMDKFMSVIENFFGGRADKTHE